VLCIVGSDPPLQCGFSGVGQSGHELYGALSGVSGWRGNKRRR